MKQSTSKFGRLIRVLCILAFVTTAKLVLGTQALVTCTAIAVVLYAVGALQPRLEPQPKA